jgi:hypothetical protein
MVISSRAHEIGVNVIRRGDLLFRQNFVDLDRLASERIESRLNGSVLALRIFN